MPLSNAERQQRLRRRRQKAAQCIADIEAILSSVDLTVWDAAHQARLRIVEYRKEA